MDIKKVIKRAGEIQTKANEALTVQDKKEQIKYSKMIEHPEDKIYLMKLMDESTQITNKPKLVKRIKFLHQKYGMLHFLSPWEKSLFNFFIWFGELAPGVSVPAFQSYLRSTTSKVIINEAPRKLHPHLEQRKKDHVGQNVNLIGEVVLGEDEALKRYHHYLESLEKPEISYMSIKVSGIYSQLHPLNFEQSKHILIERQTELYRKAIAFPVKDLNGKVNPKFINTDMEEYKDIELTYQVFTETLDKEEFKHLYAGIVLQAYLPDAAALQKRLITWAQNRVTNGGSPVKMRLVKGANLQMETVHSSLKGWEVPVHDGKIATDANYLRMIDYGFEPEHMKAVHMGIASHNLFSIAYAQKLAEIKNVKKYVSFEMLEGMANNLVRAMSHWGFNIVLYAPVVTNENFLNAVSYLVRRLDENTGEENFIAHSFNLEVNDESWKFLRQQFDEALLLKEKLTDLPRRQQNRIEEKHVAIDIAQPFTSEPDTDFDLHVNFTWAQSIAKKWKFTADMKALEYPVQVGDTEAATASFKSYIDNAQDTDIEVFKVGQATPKQVDEIIAIAEADASGWRKMNTNERHTILAKVSQKIKENRGDLIGIMTASTGKTFMEGDVELSEGIDFVEYYPRTAKAFFTHKEIEAKGKGVVLVIPPWNFPLAIPMGGVVAGLAAGNTVIIKPATASAPIAFEFVKLMHEAGVPKEALQIVLPAERASLNVLTSHPAIKHIILTGGTETAYRILENNPKVALSAETGGKNAMIVTSSADKDIAIASAVQAAFGNAGQKCSACSLLLLQDDIYDDKEFMAKLKDATESLTIGSPWDLTSEIGPMIGPDTDNKELMKVLETLEEGEEWLVKPETLDKRRYILKPGVKVGVKKGNYIFNTELFAPVLAVVRFKTLEEAIDMVNSTGYGLTSGLHSLDEREQVKWRDSIEAGNLYINRGITGAIVQRQPFGGMKESAFGNGIKAGGPNYVSCFMDITDKKVKNSKKDISTLELSPALSEAISQCKNKSMVIAAALDYKQSFKDIFSKMTDVTNIIGEDNQFRYIPAMDVALRIRHNDDLAHILMIAAATEVTGTTLEVSISPECTEKEMLKGLFAKSKIEADAEFYERAHSFKSLRLCGGTTADEIYTHAGAKGVFIADHAPLQCGRIELLNYLQEQSITSVYHRYGNLGEREA